MKNAPTIYRVTALGLLMAIAAHRMTTAHASAGTAAYQDRVRDAVAAAPRRCGPWVGRDVEVPAQATSLLLPNAMESRQYTDMDSGRWAGFVLVHCRDAHDMAGHFPLRCYPAAGWRLVSKMPRDWAAAGRTFTGTEYRFAKGGTAFGSTAAGHSDVGEIVVANFLLRPSGQIFRDMNGLAGSVLGAGGQAQGAGQVQVYFDAVTPADQRDRGVETLLAGHAAALDAILSPVAD